MDENQALREYQDRLPLWEEFLNRAIWLLRELTRDNPRIYSIQGRIKTWTSVAQKLARLGTADLSQLADIVGIRIVVTEQAEIASIMRLLLRTFRVVRGTRKEEYVWRDEPGYRNVHLFVGISEDRAALHEWKAFRDLHAEIQVQTLLASAWHEVEHRLTQMVPQDASVLVKRQAGINQTDRLDSIIDRFEALLERPGVHEKRDIQPFIQTNSFILHPNPEEILAEVPIGLGTQFRLDFLIREADGSYVLVEIESPQHHIFNKDGDFSAAVNHAVRQIEDWQEWIEDNLPTVQKSFPGISSPIGLLVIGRSKGLSKAENHRLARRNTNLRGRLMIRTYDELIANAKAFVASIRKHLLRSADARLF